MSLNKDTARDHLTLNFSEKFDFQTAECGIHLIRRLEKSKETTHHVVVESRSYKLLARSLETLKLESAF